MARTFTSCPVCAGADGNNLRNQSVGADRTDFDCTACGQFGVVGSLLAGTTLEKLTPLQRAALSHRVRSAFQEQGKPPLLTTDWFNKFMEDDTGLPSPAIQAANVIRYVGDEIKKTGRAIENLPQGIASIAGAPTQSFALSLVRDLLTNETLKDNGRGSPQNPSLQGINLTLKGWNEYEVEKRGKKAGNIGFVALKFGNPKLETLIRDHIKPAVRQIGYEVVDMRDVSRAGVIDNLMRVQIRDSAFILADLTDDNLGAYWEAGFAEGLGKPVIYLCEAARFENAKTHFDTNHCTTVMWDMAKADQFAKELIATIRRSLNLFEGT